MLPLGLEEHLNGYVIGNIMSAGEGRHCKQERYCECMWGGPPGPRSTPRSTF